MGRGRRQARHGSELPIESRSLAAVAGSDLNLRISFEPSHESVKTYELFPKLGNICGFGVDKEQLQILLHFLRLQNLNRQVCVYVLLSRMTINYVGISQNIRGRLPEHRVKKQLEHNWDRVLVFYALKQIINTDIAGFVEYTLYLRLRERGFILLQDPPSQRQLNPDDQKIARQVIVEIERILSLIDLWIPKNALSSDMVGKPLASRPDMQEPSDAEQDVAALAELRAEGKTGVEVVLASSGAKALGRYTGFGLEVFAGSLGTANVKPHMENSISYWRTRKQLEEAGIIMIEENKLRFIQNYTFASPTAAARILCGSNAPGPLRWKRRDDGTPLVKVRQISSHA